MVILYVISLFFLNYSSYVFPASSSDEDCVIPISGAPSRPPTPAGLSRLKIIRGLSAMRLDLSTVSKGVTPEHYDVAQNQIQAQINQVSLTTPRTDRSKHLVLEQIGREITRQKNALTESTTASSSSSEETSVSSTEDDLTHEELQNIITSQKIANALLTQMIVRQQDDQAHAEERVRSANIRANIEAVFGILGVVVAIIFGVLAEVH